MGDLWLAVVAGLWPANAKFRTWIFFFALTGVPNHHAQFYRLLISLFSMPSQKSRLRMKSISYSFSVIVFSLVILDFPRSCCSFEIRKVFSKFTSTPPTLSAKKELQLKKELLLQTISSTKNGKESPIDTQILVLGLVDYLETNAPASESLFTNPTEVEAVDGVWYLQYTQPSELEGVDVEKLWKAKESTLQITKKLDARKANNEGTVSFLGVVSVETGDKLTTQSIGVEDKTFANSVEQDFGTIQVKGSFELDYSIPNRIIAAFDTGILTFKNGFEIDFSFLFTLRAALKGGLKAGGWLETTYLDEDVRIGRGNRGSLFILTRDKNMVIP